MALLDVWPVLVCQLRIPTTAQKYGAVVAMGSRLRDLYKMTQRRNLMCHAVAAQYRLQCCPATKLNCMLFLAWNCNLVFRAIPSRGLAMFPGDVQETLTQLVPFVNRPFESEIHGTVNFTYFCCVLLVTWCHRVLLSCYLRPK